MAQVRATPSSVLFRDWKASTSASASTRTLLLKVERGGLVNIVVSKCFTPCFKAEVVAGLEGTEAERGSSNGRDYEGEQEEEPEQILLARDDLERGAVIQLRITMSPPDELVEVEENYKDCVVILANENIIEVPIYAIGRQVRNKSGLDVVENLDSLKNYWPKTETLRELVSNFVDCHHHAAVPRSATTTCATASSLPVSRQEAMTSAQMSNHSTGNVSNLNAFGSSSSLNNLSQMNLNGTGMIGNSSLGMDSISREMDKYPPEVVRKQRQQHHPDLTRNEIAFEIEGVFYNTLGAEIGRLPENTSIFHLNETYTEAELEVIERVERLGGQGEEELDLEESQVIADQQLIASQFVSYLHEMEDIDGGMNNLDDLGLNQSNPSRASTAATSYAGTRTNTPRGDKVGAISVLKNAPANVNSSRLRIHRKSGRNGIPILQRPPPNPYEESASPRNSRLSHREMQANWDAIEGI